MKSYGSRLAGTNDSGYQCGNWMIWKPFNIPKATPAALIVVIYCMALIWFISDEGSLMEKLLWFLWGALTTAHFHAFLREKNQQRESCSAVILILFQSACVIQRLIALRNCHSCCWGVTHWLHPLLLLQGSDPLFAAWVQCPSILKAHPVVQLPSVMVSNYT